MMRPNLWRLVFCFSVIFFLSNLCDAQDSAKLRIAVIEVSTLNQDEDQPPSLDKIVHEWLIGFLVKTKAFDVLERQQLENILQEQSLGQAGILNPDSAAQVGELLGVDILITGTILYFEDTFEVTARLINAADGTIVDVASVATDDEDELREQVQTLAEHIRDTLALFGPAGAIKLEETFDAPALNTNRWLFEFEDGVTPADRDNTQISQRDGALRISGTYPSPASSRTAWLVPARNLAFQSVETTFRVSEIEGNASVCLGLTWNDSDDWAGLCAYFEEDYGEAYISVEAENDTEVMVTRDVYLHQWYTVRLELQGTQVRYYWNNTLITTLPLSDSSDDAPLLQMGFDVDFILEDARAIEVAIDGIRLR